MLHLARSTAKTQKLKLHATPLHLQEIKSACFTPCSFVCLRPKTIASHHAAWSANSPNHGVLILHVVQCKINRSTPLTAPNWPLSHQNYLFRQWPNARMKRYDPTTGAPIWCLQRNREHCQIVAFHFCTSYNVRTTNPHVWQPQIDHHLIKIINFVKNQTQKWKRVIQQLEL